MGVQMRIRALENSSLSSPLGASGDCMIPAATVIPAAADAEQAAKVSTNVIISWLSLGVAGYAD
jgi:hypothetical protein